jgi:hypothetical protein
MGALLHKDLHRSRAWNRFPIPTKVYFSHDQDDLSIPALLIEKENQTSEYTRVSSHPAFFFLSGIVKTGLCVFLENAPQIIYRQPVKIYLI